MKLETKPYLEQKNNLPKEGRVILAQYDAESIIVYQAYRNTKIYKFLSNQLIQ